MKILLVSVLAMSFSATALALSEEDTPAVCSSLKSLEKKLANAEDRVRMASLKNGGANDVGQVVLDAAKRDRDSAQENYEEAKEQCRVESQKTTKAIEDCSNRNKTIKTQSDQKVTQTLFKWEDGECKEMAKTPTYEDSECATASQFEGGLKGENCRRAATTIADVEARNVAVTQTTTMAATAFAQVTAMQATGQQSDAQKSQQKIMQGLAVAKMTSSISQLAGAAQLKSAASGAEEASDKMNGAYKNIQTECAANQAFVDHEEDCFYATAPKHGVIASKVEYANYDRLKTGAIQSQDQADRANSMVKTSTITGLADAMVGLQAWQAARQAGKNQNGLNALPPPTFILNSGGSSMQPGIGGVAGTENMPTDFGAGGEGGALLGDVGHGGGGGSLIEGKSFGVNKSQSNKSTVSAAGGGGGLSRGGSPGSAANNKPKGKQSMGQTGVGEYSLAGGQLQMPKSEGGKKDEGGNAFADALAKLFPTDKEGKPVVDGARGPASADSAPSENGDDQSMAYATDVSLFEQVSAKIRQLTNSGRI